MSYLIQFLYKIMAFVVYNNPNPNAEETGEDIIQYLIDFEEYLNLGTPFGDMERSIGFGIIKGMDTLVHALMEILGKAYNIITFDSWLRESSAMNGTVLQRLGLGQTGAYIAAIFPIALVITGIILMFGANEIKGSKVLKNIALGGFVLAVIPWAINMMGSLTINFYSENSVNIAEEARKQASGYIYDVEWVFSDGNPYDRIKQRNELPDEYLFMIDINERVYPIANVNSQAKIYGEQNTNVYALNSNAQNWKVLRFAKRVAGGEMKVYRIPEQAIWRNARLFQPYYYRFYFKFIPLFLLYGAYIAVIVFTIGRCIRLAYEVVINHLIVTFLAATDFLSGKKLKEALLYLFYTFLILMYAVVSIVLFSKFITFVSVTGANKLGLDALGDYAGLAQALIIFVVALAVIDGPALIQRLTGIDAGLRDGYNAMDRLMHMGRGAVRTASGAIHAARNLGSGLTNMQDRINKRAKTAREGERKPETPQQAAQREKKEAEKMLASAQKKGNGKAVQIPRSGNINGRPSATMKDMSDAAKNSKAKVVSATYSMSRNSNARKDSDRDRSLDSIQRTISYAPGSKTSMQRAIQDDMKKAAAEYGVNADDYNFDGSNAAMLGYGIKDAGSTSEGSVDGPDSPFEVGNNDGWNTSDAPAEPFQPVEQPSGNQGSNEISADSNVGQPTNTASPTLEPAGQAPANNAPSSPNPTTVPERRTTAGNSPSSSPNSTTIPTRQPSSQTTVQNQGGSNTPSQGRTTGTGTTTGSSSIPVPTRVETPAPPRKESAAPPSPAARDYHAPVERYQTSSGSYTQLSMSSPTDKSQKAWATSANDAVHSVDGIGNGNMIYTQVDMVEKNDMGKTQRIGFNYEPGGDGGGYKQSFNKAMAGWREQNPDNKNYNIDSVKVFKAPAPKENNGSK